MTNVLYAGFAFVVGAGLAARGDGDLPRPCQNSAVLVRFF
jgi:hypothetical protein